jgi:hypothetical protein
MIRFESVAGGTEMHKCAAEQLRAPNPANRVVFPYWASFGPGSVMQNVR